MSPLSPSLRSLRSLFLLCALSALPLQPHGVVYAEEPAEPAEPDDLSDVGDLDDLGDLTDLEPLELPAQEASKEEAPKEESPKEETPQQKEPKKGGAWTLKKVTIIGQGEKLTRVSGSAHVVDKEALEEQAYEDVHRVLKQVPGVYVRDEDGQGLRPNIGLRGANSDRSAKVTLMEDGVLMAPAPYAAPAAYYFPITSRLVGVEVFKGPASIQYGPNTIGGALNLQTRPTPTQGQEGGLDLSYGMFNSSTLQARYGIGNERMGLLLEGARVASDGFKELDGGGNTGFEKRELMLKAHLASDPNAEVAHRLDLKLGFTDERSNETYLGLTQEDFEATPYRRYAASQLGLMSWWRTQAKLDYSAFIGDNLDVKLTLYRHDFSRVWEKLDDLAGDVRLSDALITPNSARNAPLISLLRGERDSVAGDVNDLLLIGRNDRVYVSQGAQGALTWRARLFGLKNSLTLGVRAHADEVVRDQTQRTFAMQGGSLVAEGERASTRQDTGSAFALSAHLFDQLELSERVRLTPGVRVERYNTSLEDRTEGDPTLYEGDELVLLPGVGLWWGLNDYAGLLAGVHKGFSPLSPGMTGKASPEESLNYEMGARWQSPFVSGELIGFYNDYTNLVGTCTQSAGCAVDDLDTQFNAGRAGVVGAELVLNTSLQLPAMITAHAHLTYTWTRARFLEAFSSGFAQWGEVSEGDALPYLPEHQMSARLRFERGAFGLGGVWSYMGQMRDSAGTGEAGGTDLIPAISMLDLNAHWQATTRSRLYLTLDNALNNQALSSWRPFGARPAKPLSLRAGYRYQF